MLIVKPPDDRLIIWTPDGDEHSLGAPSIMEMSMPLVQWLRKASTDLLHNVGAASGAARKAIHSTARTLIQCAQLDPETVPWLRVALVDPLGQHRAPQDPTAASTSLTPRAPALTAPTQPPTLSAPTLEGFAARLAAAPPSSVIVMVGAGMSVSAGIPDFRTPGSGLYDNLQEYQLPYPEAIFDIRYWPSNPAAFYRLAKELWPGQYTPTASHRFLNMLHEKGKLRRVFTQNIDSLEREAGLPADMVIPAHGNFDDAFVYPYTDQSETSVSPQSRRPIPVEEMRRAVMAGEAGWKALNSQHEGLCKPGITFFHEPLPKRFAEAVQRDFTPRSSRSGAAADNGNLTTGTGDAGLTLLILGTSLKVQPFASLVARVPRGTPRLLINRERVGEDLGLRFDHSEETLDEHEAGASYASANDVFWRGDCDAGVRSLCASMGWEEP